MIYTETDELIIFEDYFMSFGHAKDHSVIGICLFNKYCWTNIFGFEILKAEE
jgi:hypothetical protein